MQLLGLRNYRDDNQPDRGVAGRAGLSALSRFHPKKRSVRRVTLTGSGRVR
jgi:hypothetical protein